MSTTPKEIRPWRTCPFRVGARYRVRGSFATLRASFIAGEILVFDSDAWSRYDGITGYSFSGAGVEGLRTWDISDDEDLEIWRLHFEELSA